MSDPLDYDEIARREAKTWHELPGPYHGTKGVLLTVAERDALVARAREADLAIRTQQLLADICQSEGPRGETMCMKPLGHKGRCGWESRR